MPTDFEPPGGKGRIVLTPCMMCGHCQGWHDFEERTKAAAAKMARTMGWELDRVWGWLCPSCIHNRDCPICQTNRNICQEGWNLHMIYGGARWTNPTDTATSEPTE